MTPCRILCFAALVAAAGATGATGEVGEVGSAGHNCTDHDLRWSSSGGAPRVEVPSTCTLLDLANTRVGDGTAEALAASLAANAVRGVDNVAVLRLQRNSIGDVGLAALAGYLGLGGSAVEVLHLSSNDIKDEGMAALAISIKCESFSSCLMAMLAPRRFDSSNYIFLLLGFQWTHRFFF